jgi:hypothetical protein
MSAKKLQSNLALSFLISFTSKRIHFFYFQFSFLILFSLFLLFSCTPELTPPKPDAGDADFSKTVAIGGNYLSGYQDGALYDKGQRLCIPSLLAQQFKLIGGSAFNQVFMPDEKGLGLNNKPWESVFISAGYLINQTDCKGMTSLLPFNNHVSFSAALPYLTGMAGNSNQNVSAPFAVISDYFNPLFGEVPSATGNSNPYFNRIAGNPGVSTMYSDAKMQNASFITAWIGMEDIYNFAASGGTNGSIESSATFSIYLDSLLKGLTANEAKGVIANIPDFRNYPYYTLVPWDNIKVDNQSQADSLNNLYAGNNQIHFNIGKNGSVIIDSLNPAGIRQMHSGEYITLSVPLDSIKCNNYGLYIGINDRYILNSTEVNKIDQAITEYNFVIAQKAAQYNLALVDIHSYFNSLRSGIKWDEVYFSQQFIPGGFFSLDGYHPNQQGYAMIANEFLKAINSKYNSVIPTINCTGCNGILFP